MQDFRIVLMLITALGLPTQGKVVTITWICWAAVSNSLMFTNRVADSSSLSLPSPPSKKILSIHIRFCPYCTLEVLHISLVNGGKNTQIPSQQWSMK